MMRKRTPRIDLNVQLEARTVQSLAVEKLRGAITRGDFSPGEKLVEADLCERLGISRPSLREALRTLEGERLVTLIPNRGPHVANLTWKDALDIYHVRAVLEGEAAFLAATLAKPEHLQGMKEALSLFKKAARAGDIMQEVEATRIFYEHLLQASNNGIIQDVLHGLLSRINFLRSRSMSAANRALSSAKEMAAILEEISARNPDGARDAAVYHIQQACKSAELVFQRLYSNEKTQTE